MRLPRWLFIPVILVGILYWSQDLWKGDSEPSVFDLPKTLEDEVLTLEIYPVSNVNDVPVWTTSTGSNDEDRLYLTPASDTVNFPEHYTELRDSGYVLQVHGSFYKGHGIPAEYLKVNPKPERLRVFKVDRIEIVRPKQSV